MDYLLNIGSIPRKQGKFRPNEAENIDFAVLDLTFARIVNGPRLPAAFVREAAAMGP
jgi:hypothetical protein